MEFHCGLCKSASIAMISTKYFDISGAYRRWVGVKFVRSVAGVEYLEFVAKPQLLPAKYRDFEEMTTLDY